ncbi:MFS general substrate transporter [Pisolithus albus]|nr:MFS general substrate transporter [Pisolithus albus]KAI5985638.1 MFS general substrate transporter [Pisolithus albus]
MLEEKTLVLPDIELGFTPAEPNAIGDDQKIDEKTFQDITDKYIQYAGGAPDGGLKAWSVIMAVPLHPIIINFCRIRSLPSLSLGYVNSSWGIFQEYYERVLLSNKSPSTIAWIGSVQVAFIFLPGLITGRLFDLGHFKIPFFTASCGLIACTFLTAECKQYWQFFLVQGLFTGLFSGIIYGQAISVVSHWFSERKGTALGIVSIGSSLGGILFPIAGRSLIPSIGFKWTVRVFGFMMLVALGIANLAIDRRLPPVNVKGGLVNLSAFRNPAYTTYCVSGIACYLGLYTMPTYLPVSATAVGMSNSFSFFLVAITNASSGFGRLFAGFLADHIGPLNAMIPFRALAGILTFAWPYASSQGALVGVSVLYGIASGIYVSLMVAPAMAMGDVSDVGRRVGMFLTIAALGTLVGTPTSGVINARTGGFKGPGFYAGEHPPLQYLSLLRRFPCSIASLFPPSFLFIP